MGLWQPTQCAYRDSVEPIPRPTKKARYPQGPGLSHLKRASARAASESAIIVPHLRQCCVSRSRSRIAFAKSSPGTKSAMPGADIPLNSTLPWWPQAGHVFFRHLVNIVGTNCLSFQPPRSPFSIRSATSRLFSAPLPSRDNARSRINFCVSSVTSISSRSASALGWLTVWLRFTSSKIRFSFCAFDTD